MSRVKEIADISKEIIQKLDKAITQTVNAWIFYAKYKVTAGWVKRMYEQKYVPL